MRTEDQLAIAGAGQNRRTMKTNAPKLNWVHDWPIRQKLMLVIMLTCGAVLLLACGLLGAYQGYKFSESLARNDTVLADVLARNTQAALSFQDQNAAQQTLQALQADSTVTSACLYDANNVRFATYLREGNQALFPDRLQPDGHYFSTSSLVVLRPVVLNGRRIGTIYLQTSLEASMNACASSSDSRSSSSSFRAWPRLGFRRVCSGRFHGRSMP